MMNKKITYPPELRVWSIVLMFLFSVGIFGQNAHNPVLTWDQEVGCIEYDDKGERDYYDLYEQISQGVCLRVCEESTVTYTFSADDLVSVEWQVTGGHVENSNNTGAIIKWHSSGNGSLTLTCTYSDSTVEVLTMCVEKVISPRAYFEVDGPEPDQREFCTFFPISFNNLSNDNGGSAIVNYLWDFGDGTTSSLFEPTHTYEHPGVYTVTLTVTNSCNCSSVYKWEVSVKDAREFEITCASVVCEGARETYSVTDGCGGDWKVLGGTIVADNGTSIEVVWDHVDPEDGFGYVSYLSKCSCPFWTTVKIPVILHSSQIKGPGVVCEGAQGRFTLPQWPTTHFEWMIDGDPTHHMLVRTDQRNEIVVNGATPGTYTLSAAYRNTLINDGKCEGYAEIKFTVEERPQIITNQNLTNCQHSSMTFYTHNGVSVVWQVLLDGNVVNTHSGSSMVYDFPNSGTHVINADYNGCISDPLMVEVVELPVITGTIDGPDKVCLDTPYTYTLSEEEPGYVYVWSVINGEVIGDNTGANVDVLITGSPAKVRVVKQAVKNGVICESEVVEFDVTEVDLNPVIINNSGLPRFCPSSSATFTVDLDGVVADLIIWSIRSTSGATNFGSIISGINSTTATVGFNEISALSTGVLQVDVIKCGETFTKTYPIELIATPTFSIGTMANICPTDPTVSIPITITPAPTTPVSIKVLVDGVEEGTYSYSGGGILTVNNSFTNSSNSNISRNLTLQLGMCNYTVSASQNVIVYPKTEVYVSPQYSYVVCPSTYGSINLTSTVSTGITSTTTFTWFKGTVQQQTGPSPNFSITGANPGGTYYVVVTDQNGCDVRSSNIYVTEDCSGGGPGGCTITPNPSASVLAEWTDCSEITAEVDYDGNPDIMWTGSTYLTLTGGQGTDNATFTTTVPGAHVVTAYLNYNGCTIIRTYTVEKKYQAVMSPEITCNGDGTYKIVLHNHSLTYNAGSINPLTFEYFGPNVPAGASGNSATISSIGPGTHVYTMKVNAPGSGTPECEATLTITLENEPSPNFTVPANNSQYCSDDVVLLTIPGYNSNNVYEWIFNGTSYIADGAETPVQFSEIGSYPIRLKVTTAYGCTYETPIANRPTIHIRKANFDIGTIVPNVADFCDNNSVTPLSYTPADPFNPPTDIIWMLDNEEIATGMTYQPTQSGSYWPVLIDQYGCKSYVMATKSKNYVLRQPPYAGISGSTNVCFGENTVLYGITTDDTVEHRWDGPTLPAGYDNWVAGTGNKILHLNNLTPGSYDYIFYTRAANDHSCEGSFTVTVVVHPEVPTPILSAAVSNCDPFTVTLTVTNPQAGVYNWSNGMTGTSIEVTHGGAYSATHTALSGCSAIGYIQAPHNPQRVLWVVPSGCYTVCGTYLLGPLGTYEGYEWLVNGVTEQIGGGFVPEQHINTGGDYQLLLTQGCTFGSNIPHIVPNVEKCPPGPCGFKFDFASFEVITGGFTYYLNIDNPTGTTQVINLSSFYGYGTFVPAVHILNPGANMVVVDFYVNGTFYPGANDLFVINGHHCADMIPVTFSETHWAGKNVQPATLSVSPNPATETTTVSFDIGSEYQHAQTLVVFDVMGVQRHTQKVSGKTGETMLNISFLPSGTYVIVLEADGQRIATEKLIKK